MAKQYTGFLAQVRSNRRLLLSYDKCYNETVKIGEAYDFMLKYFSSKKVEIVKSEASNVEYMFKTAFINNCILQFFSAYQYHLKSKNVLPQIKIGVVINMMSLLFRAKALFVTSIIQYKKMAEIPIDIKGKKCYIAYLDDIFIYSPHAYRMKASVFHAQKDQFMHFIISPGFEKDDPIFNDILVAKKDQDEYVEEDEFNRIYDELTVDMSSLSYCDMISLNSIIRDRSKSLVSKLEYEKTLINMQILTKNSYSNKVVQILRDMYNQYFKSNLEKLHKANAYIFDVKYIAKVNSVIVLDIILRLYFHVDKYNVENVKQIVYKILESFLGTNYFDIKIHNNFIETNLKYMYCTIKFIMVIPWSEK